MPSLICDTTLQSEVQSEELLELLDVFGATAAAVALLSNKSTLYSSSLL